MAHIKRELSSKVSFCGNRYMPISRRTLVERINRLLRSIERRSGEPDRWEGHCIRQALEALHDGDIERGRAHVDLAKMPPELRTSGMLMGFFPDSHNPTLPELRAELERIAENETTAAGDKS